MTTSIAALHEVLAQFFDWPAESIPLNQTTNRTLRQPIYADRDQPPFDRVAMDGIAINHSAYATGKRRFPVSHMAPAGTAPQALKDAMMCVEVMTGAPLPPGTTTVIRYEDLKRQDKDFIVPDGVDNGQSIHRRGSDAKKGDLMLSEAVRIGPAQAAILATYGTSEVSVTRLPRVAIASTGDEVVAVDQVPLDHQIRSSNVHQLATLFRDFGIEPTLDHLPDDAADGEQKLRQLINDHDLLLLSGGVSKGKLDHVPDWLTRAGIKCLFHRVAQRPGKPLWVGRNDDTMVFALPGNPVSSLVGAVAYVGPFLRRQLGISRPSARVILAEEIHFVPDLTLFQQVRIENREGRLYAIPVGSGGSGNLVGLLEADGFVVLPSGRDTFMAGEVVDFLPLQF